MSTPWTRQIRGRDSEAAGSGSVLRESLDHVYTEASEEFADHERETHDSTNVAFSPGRRRRATG